MESKQRPSLDDGFSTTSSIIRRMTTHNSGQRRLRRNSGPSSPLPTIAPPVAEVPPSCVARETLDNECGLHRFIVWAAIKRNSCSEMTAEERRECPLLRCRKRFANHELMLQHLYTCDQLAAAEYWCYDCGKVERFNDAKCRRCLGHPSKRRKIVSMARNFFSSLGHRNRHGHLADADLDLDMDEAPPSYDSILEPSQTELSSNEIHEMGATDRTCAPPVDVEVTVAADPTPQTGGESCFEPLIEPLSPLETAPPAHPIVMAPPIPVPPVELDSVSIDDVLINWEPSPTPPLRNPGSPFQLSPARTPDKPVLQLHTSGLGQYRPKTTVTTAATMTTTTTTSRSKTLAPSSSVRSTCSTASNQSVVSTSSYEVTPLSAWSGTWDRAAGFDSTQTSPDDVINMDDLVPSTSLANFAKMETAKEKYGGFDDGDGFLAELPADLPMINPFSAVSLLPGTLDTNQSVWSFDATVPTELSIESNVALTDPVNIPLDMSELLAEQSWNYQVDASSLVESVQATLQAHVQNSMLKLEHVSHYRLANEFCNMSPEAVALAGLKSLQAILEGSTVLSSVDVVCFVHLVYSLVLVIHEQDIPSRVKDLFLQARSYMSYVLPQDAAEYSYVVDALWAPNDGHNGLVTSHGQTFAGNQLAGMSNMSEKMRGKQPQDYMVSLSNEFLSVSQHFLDELEHSVWNRANRVEVVASELYVQHLSDQNLPAPPDSPLFYAMSYLIKRLWQEYGNGVPAFVSSLRNMLDRLDSNFSVRRLELELLHAGRIYLPPTLFFDRYITSVRTQIDSLHAQTQLGPLDRTNYYLKGIKLMQALIHGPMLSPTTGWETSMAPTATTFEPLDNYMNSITPNLGHTPDLPLAPGSALHSMDNSPATTTMPGLGLNISTLSPTPYLTNADAAMTPARRSSAAATAMTPPSPAASSSPAKLIEADMSCDQCGYRPKGDPKWFGGSMAKHKKLQHATSPPKIYSCPYPGCTSQYKNRPDNLRQHQLDKGHFVDGQDEESRRSSKRKRTK